MKSDSPTQPGKNTARKGPRAGGLSRRQFLQAGAAGLLAGSARGQSTPDGPRASTPSVPPSGGGGGSGGGSGGSRPNIVFISCDQLALSAISAYGCPYVRTPNIDRLVRGGTSFMQTYTANPLCSPARSSWFTGRMPSETGVAGNERAIRADMPTMGTVFQSSGYDTYYCGKWHLPDELSHAIPGFRVLPGGIHTPETPGDIAISQACEALLTQHSFSQPFLLVAAMYQPHDICSWVPQHGTNVRRLPYGLSESDLPPLPPNFNFDPREPKAAFVGKGAAHRITDWTPLQWRYYLWSYHRLVEMADAQVGRILDAIEASPHRDNTMILFASDHGEGQGRHRMVLKNYLYEDPVKVPLIAHWPGHIAPGAQDPSHLASSTDILPTMCDYASIATPQRVVGRSLRPLLEGNKTTWRDMVAAEVMYIGRMIRTGDFKYITYRRDPVEQLFDLKHDPGEMKNLAGEGQFAAALDDHRKLLADWEKRLDVTPTGPHSPTKSKSWRLNVLP